MKQNLTRKPVNKQIFFSVTGMSDLVFSVRERFGLKIWLPLKTVLVLKKWSWSFNLVVLLHHCRGVPPHPHPSEGVG